MKGLLAYIIATYDLKFDEGQSALRGSRIAGVRIPANAKVMFRARQK